MVTTDVAAVVVVLLRVKGGLSSIGCLPLMLILNRFALLILVCHEAAAFEENDDARDVVDRVFFSLPGCH